MRKFVFLLSLSIFFASFRVPVIHAANAPSATMSVFPSTGSFDQSFKIDIVVDGGGQVFNAAQATIAVSSGLSISDLTLGDCNFSFLATPSIANPSFSAVILGGSSKKCNVYTLTLAPITKGSASIVLSKAIVKRFGDAADIFSKSQDGAYELTATMTTTISPHQIAQPKDNLYTLVLKLLNSDNTPITSTDVKVSGVADKSIFQAKTDKTGTVQFADLKSGVYTATVANYDEDNILNVAGNNHVLVMGMKLKRRVGTLFFDPFIIGGILVIGIIVGTTLIVIFGKMKRKQ